MGGRKRPARTHLPSSDKRSSHVALVSTFFPSDTLQAEYFTTNFSLSFLNILRELLAGDTAGSRIIGCCPLVTYLFIYLFASCWLPGAPNLKNPGDHAAADAK